MLHVVHDIAPWEVATPVFENGTAWSPPKLKIGRRHLESRIVRVPVIGFRLGLRFRASRQPDDSGVDVNSLNRNIVVVARRQGGCVVCLSVPPMTPANKAQRT